MQSHNIEDQATPSLLSSPSGNPFLGKVSSHGKSLITKASPCHNTFISVMACFMVINGHYWVLVSNIGLVPEIFYQYSIACFNSFDVTTIHLETEFMQPK